MYLFKLASVILSIVAYCNAAQQHPSLNHGGSLFHNQPIPHGGFVVQHPPVFNGFDHIIPQRTPAAIPRLPNLFSGHKQILPQHAPVLPAGGIHGFGYDINFSSPKELASDDGGHHLFLHNGGGGGGGAASPLGAAHHAPVAPRSHKGHFVPGSAHVTVKGTPHSYNYNVKQTHGKDGTSYVWAGGEYTHHKGHGGGHGGQAY